jgi:signal transduction histidine kinase
MVGRADRLAGEDLKPLLKDIAGMTAEIIKQVRTLSLSLRPGVLDDLGLVPAMEWLFKQLRTRADLDVHFEHTGVSTLSAELSTAIYRITQEALTNIMRHSGVKEAWIRLEIQDGQLSLEIMDKGRGFDRAAADTSRSTGLSAMKERASLLGGSWFIESKPGHGTTVTVFLPLNR